MYLTLGSFRKSLKYKTWLKKKCMYGIKAKIVAPRDLSLSKISSGPGDHLSLESQQEVKFSNYQSSQRGSCSGKIQRIKRHLCWCWWLRSCWYQNLSPLPQLHFPSYLWLLCEGDIEGYICRNLTLTWQEAIHTALTVFTKVGHSRTPLLWDKLYKAS